MEQASPFSEKTVKLIVHKGRVCGKFDTSHVNKLAALGLGTWHAEWKCYVFELNDYTCWRLIKEFKEDIATCDPLIKEKALAYHEGQATKSATNLPDIPGLTRPAWGHQRQGYYFAHGLAGAMLAMGMGCGKTMTTIGLIVNREHERNLIICPKSVIPVWPLEFSRNTTEKFHIATAVSGNSKKSAESLVEGLKNAKQRGLPFVFIVNYDSAWRDALKDIILKTQWDHVIFDESHRAKDASAKTSRFCAKLVKNSRYRIALTGTPMPHSPMDIFAQFLALDQSIFGTKKYLFENRYARKGGYLNKQIVEFINQEELSLKFQQIAYRVTSEILDLPPATHTRKVCDLEPAAQKAYDLMEDEMYFEILNEEISAANALVKILRLQQITSGYIKNDEGAYMRVSAAKQALLRDTLADIDDDEPIVIFAVFKTDIAAIREELKHAKRSIAELSGERNDLDAWQKGKMNAIVVQIRSGGVGVDLTRSCIQMYYSVSHSMGDYEQSIARTHRPGQTRPVRFIHLTVRNTIDEAIYLALEKKKETVDYVLEHIKRRRNNESEMSDA